MLTEPNGLIQKFCVYAGAMDELSGVGHTEKVVLHLLSERLGKGQSVYMSITFIIVFLWLVPF